MGEHLLCTQGVASSILVASTPGKGSHRNIFALSLLLAGCAAKRVLSGMVIEDAGSIYILDGPDNRTKLRLSGDNVAVEALLGCRVSVRGQRGPGGFAVDAYEVVDAGFGARPLVGTIETSSGLWYLRDRKTGVRSQLSGEMAYRLGAHRGDLALIDGVSLGPNEVQVMSYRILLDVPPHGGGKSE